MICERCHAFEDDGSLEEQIQAYLNRMDPEICCDDETYAQRLFQCESCQDLYNAMCRFCGCFVILRARKKNGSCPNPSGDRWKQI